MATLVTLIREIAKRMPEYYLHGHHATHEELTNDLSSFFMMEQELPEQLASSIRQLLWERFNTVRRKLQRDHNRKKLLAKNCWPIDAVNDPSAQISMRERVQFVKATARSNFERELVEAELQDRFTEFATAEETCSRAEAYKRRQRFFDHVRSVARSESAE